MRHHGKLQYLIDNDEVHNLARLAALIEYIEYLLELPEVSGIEVIDEDRIVVGLSSNTQLLKPPKILDNEVSIEIIHGFIESNYSWLYEHSSRKFMELANNLLKPHTFNTDRNCVEFFLAIFSNGKAVLLEGERLRIMVPTIKAYYTAHTHPRNYIMPSSKDVRSLIDLFTYGGVASAIITSSTSLCIYRKGPFTLEDYETLIRVSRIKPKNINELNELLRQSNIKFIIK